jgi:RNA polymerase sigma-70 factor (ECF subfamily)
MRELLSDAELLAGADAANFRMFYERHAPAVVAYVARRSRQPDLALDVVAETFARALERRDQYDAERGPAIAWLLGIARNEIGGALRRGRVADEYRRRLGMAPIELDDEGNAAMARHLALDLKDALSGLSSEHREAVVRRFLVDESYADIAEDVGCSEQVVRKRVSRGLAVLREALQENP